MKMNILIFSLFSVSANSACNVIEDGACEVYGQEAIDGVNSIQGRSGTLFGQESADFRDNLVRVHSKTIVISIYDCGDNIVEKISTPFPINGISSLSGPRVQLTIKAIKTTENFEILKVNFSHFPDKHSGINIDTKILLNNEETEIGSSCTSRTTHMLDTDKIETVNTGYRYTVELIQ